MWEQIQANKRRSVFLVFCMAAILVALGYFIGEAFARGGGAFGTAVAVGIWAVMGLVSYYQGSAILLASSGARRVEKEDDPRLYNVVEEMSIAAGFKQVPDIYIIDTPALNAFATGRDPEHSAVAVTAGLLGRLNRDQLQGVIAHEMSHVANRDILFMTLVGVMLGAITIIAEVYLRGMFYSGGMRRSRSSSDSNGQAQALMMVIALVLAILAPIIGQLIYFAASRRREYLADASGAMLTRYPEGLASALEAISQDPSPQLQQANRATAPLYIENPLRRSAVGLFTTHPPIEERVRILRGMAGGEVSYKAYQQSLEQVSGDRAGRMPASALAAQAESARGAFRRRTGPRPRGRANRRHPPADCHGHAPQPDAPGLRHRPQSPWIPVHRV